MNVVYEIRISLGFFILVRYIFKEDLKERRIFIVFKLYRCIWVWKKEIEFSELKEELLVCYVFCWVFFFRILKVGGVMFIF